jgi:Ca2+-binding EF-hand superfamily protein
MRYLLFCTVFLAGSALSVVQADTEPEKQNAAPASQSGQREAIVDVVFLGEGRPALWRFNLYVDGKPYPARWEAALGKLFDLLDRNKDGVLDKEEAARALAPAQMAQLLSGRSYLQAAPKREGILPGMDANKDGQVSRAEFLAYYRDQNLGPVVVAGVNPNRNQGNPGMAGPVRGGDVLFDLLDTNKDGKLSRAELEAAEAVLMPYDQNDDELISLAEIQGTATRGSGARRIVRRVPPASSLMLVPSEVGGKRMAGRLQIARTILTRYDRDKDNKLSPAEITLPDKEFARLDINRDGKLDILELLRWVGGRPQAEMTFRLGGPQRMVRPGTRPVRKAGGPGGGERGSYALSVDTARITVMAGPNVGIRARQDYSRYFLNLFQQVDKDRKGFVTRAQLTRPQDTTLRAILDLADSDGDDKLTEKKIRTYVAVVRELAGCQLNLSLVPVGQGLFSYLDANGDGQLSVREMRNAWERLKDLDTDGDGCISRREFPEQFRLTVGVGPATGLVAPPVPFGGAPMVARPPARRGPAWFHKMDRNGDGDVSRKEWLGTEEDFKKIDLDGDGLISLEEAEKADALFRKAQKK